ncbi:MAG: lipoate--protein ligase family protein [Prevotella sp.]|jgi:lipoic acid synthetase/lipoate-protein ligase A
MIHIQLAQNNPHQLSFYLAMEEYVAKNLNFDEDCFFMWQVEPTVIFGRNQDIENEVNLEYCKQHGIKFFRRKSGGGCVYADMSNVMSSFITKEDNVDEAFARYLKMMSETLESIGLKDVHPSGHNDIMIGDKKVSGNAIYHIPGKIIAHGTLLYDTDMENMLHAITPSVQKLSKHGVQSVRQRICLLKDYTDLPFPEIRKRIIEHLCDKSYTLGEDDEKGIKQIEQEYLQPKFIYGK